MRTIYISDSGDDKNDGLSLKTAIYSLKRAKELDGGRNDSSWHFGPLMAHSGHFLRLN